MRLKLPILLGLLMAMAFGELQAQQSSVNDTASVNLALREAREVLYKDIRKGLILTEKALKAAEAIQYEAGQAMAWHYLGRVALDTGNYQGAIDAQDKTLQLIKGLNNQGRLKAGAFNMKGIASEKMGLYKVAVSNYLQAIRLFDMLKDSSGLTNTYNNIGLVHNTQGNHERADRYYQKAFDLASGMGDEFLMITTRNNMGLSLLQQKRYSEAKSHFQATLEFDLEDGSAEYIGGSYNNLGSCELKMGNYAVAYSLYEKAISYKRQAEDNFGLTISLINLGQTLTQLEKYNQAKEALYEAVQISKKTGVKQHESEAYLHLSTLLDSLGDPASSLFYYRTYQSLRDSLYLIEQRLEIERLQTEYNVEKKDLEIGNQQVLLEKQKFQLHVFIAALLLISIGLIVLTILIYNIRKLNRKLNDKQEQLELKNQLLHKTNDKLSQARDLAERSSRAKSNFLSNVSHEIRTPMNVIMGLSQLLQDERLSSKGRQNIHFIQESSNHLLHIINDILDLSKIEAGKITFDDSNFHLTELLEQLRVSMETLKTGKDIKLEFKWPADLPDYFRGDRTRLQQILTNVVSNAIKFTEHGKVQLELEITDRSNDLYQLKFTISDSGIGIPADRLDKIFDSFTQAEEDHSRTYGGTGLGLTITKKLVELQGGSIRVKSMFQEGSEFTIQLSYFADSPSELLPDLEKVNNKVDFSNLRILLVEDNRLNINLATQLFKKWKALYAIAENGYEALDQLKKMNFDIILLDLHMPGINGFETFKAIRKNEINTPVVALTADAFEDTRDKVKTMGFDEMLIKPYRAEELIRLIQKLAKRN